ncbi:acyl-CoA dehydrogenase [Desulfatitalea alkaliphila]|uniref:Acyl-CoA dehydrogenase n=1 Tax=Desulfatitalea alkaliphila TaxID=2929485 RepID=A0AA41UJI7_9BACT|nr:acyl-CoA dehydrogenase [Desulfatitalea alkaliphila]MCJ8501179.1 acyl-CoA dehydrogenase [Desulfatitalea alkaliphila]
MAKKYVSRRNLEFMLYEVFDIVGMTQYPYYSAHNKKMFDMTLDAALKLSKDLLNPIFEEMDRQGPVLENGKVKVHPMVRTIMQRFGEGGWIAAKFQEEFDGAQLPYLIADACNFIFSAANYSAHVFPGLTSKAARLITSFGSQEQIDTYVPKMLNGEWQGTMALTEPQAGSSLADITTTAVPTDKGYYLLQGQKIFISAGDHDGVDNVVQMLLAKIEGAPAGVKGISMFIVPNQRIAADGGLEPNDVTITQIYHKMGYRGAPITELSLGEKGDCRGWLVGEPHNGLSYMFQMMNGSRLGVGMGAIGISSAAYYAALDYARERPQGRLVPDPATAQVPIIEHADVRRMLLFQRAFVEGAFSLLMQCCRYSDLELAVEGEEKEKASLLLDLLIPVAKTYPSETSILSTSQAIQIFGGYGYCEDFPVEQHFRDTRIHAIHEGTTGIQGMDILGRKVRMKGGKAFTLFVQEVNATIAAARALEKLAPYADRLATALEELQQVTEQLKGFGEEKGTRAMLADATLYLEYFSLIAIAWQWLLQSIAAEKALAGKPSQSNQQFYQGKLHTTRYFFHYELPKTAGLAQRLKEQEAITLEMEKDIFND